MDSESKKEALISRNRSSKNGKREILYQNILGRWFAFTEHNGDVYFGPIDGLELNEVEQDEFKRISTEVAA